MSNDLPYWIALHKFPGFGPTRMTRLMRRFPSMERAFNASASQLVEAGIEPKITNRFLQERIHINPEELHRELEVHHVEAITLVDERYPPLLKQIFDPPAVLYVRGALPDSNRPHLAVVGSRKATSYGLRAAEDLVTAASQAGVVIVSGLAYGIDSAAHDACVQAGGTTVAVLASGVDESSVYPSRNRALASRIIANGGALVSEFPLGTHPLKGHFPVRNRIIAGLCQGTLVIEATIKSGSLITARAAADMNRDVYAVPGSIYAQMSEGPNDLIKHGAIPVTSVEDLFGTEGAPKAPSDYAPSNEIENAIFLSLETSALHVDEIIRKTSLPSETVLSTLTIMEMKGGVKDQGGQCYTRIA